MRNEIGICGHCMGRIYTPEDGFLHVASGQIFHYGRRTDAPLGVDCYRSGCYLTYKLKHLDLEDSALIPLEMLDNSGRIAERRRGIRDFRRLFDNDESGAALDEFEATVLRAIEIFFP